MRARWICCSAGGTGERGIRMTAGICQGRGQRPDKGRQQMKKDFVLCGCFCTHVTTGTEQVVKRLKSSGLQSGSQQQLTSHCATSRSHTHSLATAAEREMRTALGT